MSKEHKDSDKRFIDTIPSVSLKKDGIPSTHDILDIISYLEKEKKLDSYQAMMRYLNTTDIEALDNHLKEMGLKSSEAVKQVVDAMKGLKKVNTDLKRLHYNLTAYAPYSSYLSNLNDVVQPFVLRPIAIDGLADAMKIEMPALNALQDALNSVRVDMPASNALQEALDSVRVNMPAVDVLQEALAKLRFSTPALNALQDALNSVRVDMPASNALQEALDSVRVNMPASAALQQTIQQIQTSNFEPFLPATELPLVKSLNVAPTLDRPVNELVETLEETETGLAKTARSVSKAYKPRRPRINIKDETFLKDLYWRSAEKNGQKDTLVSFQMFDANDSDKLEIALYLDDLGLIDVSDDHSVSITQKGAKFVEQKILQEPPDKKKGPPESDNLVKPIFLGHGHDKEMKKKVTRALTAWKITYIALADEPDLGRPNIGKFRDICDDLDCGLVLLSADDKCYKKRKDRPGKLAAKSDIREKSRARQNVIWELGYCYGHYGDRTIIVYKEDEEFEWPSNLGTGIGYVPYLDQDWRQKLKLELKARDYGGAMHAFFQKGCRNISEKVCWSSTSRVSAIKSFFAQVQWHIFACALIAHIVAVGDHIPKRSLFSATFAEFCHAAKGFAGTDK
jgi:predicted nucleotide-binding protein